MYKHKRNYSKVLVFMLAIIMVLTLIPQTAFADGEGSGYPDSEWSSLTNSENNNCMTDKETPISPKLSKLKWGVKHGGGWSASVSPPIIVGGFLYSTVGNKIRKINKETGETVKEVSIAGSAAYAMNPAAYAEGKLFIQIGNGRVQALDINTLESLWVSEKIGGQTVSNITYKNGYVYTGTWNSEKTDGAFICMSASATDDIEVVDNVKTKKLKWQMKPSVGVITEGGISSAAGVTSPCGFYWTGAYVSDDYMILGSDDGSPEKTYTETAVLYSMHPVTGKVIATMGGIRGDIRSNIVYHKGHAFFSTKGERLYKVAINEDGTFGQSSYVSTGGMMTASPVIYNDRIYIGVSGQSQFDADSDHNFTVIKNDNVLTQDSILYKTRIPGYPQATSLLSTHYEKDTGSLYIYYTLNANPGGIYCYKDNAKESKGETFQLFAPPKEMQNYCISTISCDNEGTLYYKNDSGYLMAIENNDAYIEDIGIKPNTGDARWLTDFSSETLDYTVKAPSNSTKADVTLTLPQGTMATIGGVKYNNKYVCDLSQGNVNFTIEVAKGDKTRIYNIKLLKKSTDSTLSELKATVSNSYSGTVLPLRDTFTSSAVNLKTTVYNGTEKFVRLWLTTTNEYSAVNVVPVDNVGNGSSNLNEDGSIKAIYSSAAKKNYYSVYFTVGQTYSKVRIDVTSEESTVTSYYLTIYRDPSVSDIGDPRIEIDKDNITVFSKGPGSSESLSAKVIGYIGGFSWESENPSIAKVNSKGVVEGVKPGTTKIIADCGVTSAACTVTVKAPTLELSTNNLTLDKVGANNTATIKATVNGYENQNASWSVSGGNQVVSVDSKGVVTAKEAGTAVITAEANGITKTCSVTVNHNSTKDKTAITKKSCPKSFKAAAQKKKAKLSWKKSKDITKYEVAYKQSSKKKWTYKSISSKKNTVTIKKLKSGKKYKFKIRSYKLVDGERVNSKWSKTKTIKIK